ncbi:MAG: ABC transporter ATP-binding protein [Bacteroidetes bacterium]|nr:ABC transporter ATP-binding protein [Bacteroidota bacterium]
MPPLLSIQNLTVQFRNEGQLSTAVQNFSMEVKKGETVAIVGESGSGKSVTSLSLLQLLSGNAVITGKTLFHRTERQPVNLVKLPPQTINRIRGKDIAMIFQEPMTSLNPVFTCGHQVIEAIRAHENISAADAKRRAIGLFRKVRLPDPESIVDRYPHELSGGQKQRVMIAMAISCNPSLLIADEPTTALDVTVQKTILELIKELQVQNKMSVILITHDLGVVADIADRVVVMYKGTLVEQGTTAAILQNPQQPYTRALLACRPAGKTKGERLPVVSDFLGAGAERPASVFQTITPTPAVLPDTPDIVLEVDHLKVYYPLKKNLFGKTRDYFRAVDDVSFVVKQGETLGLVGESGCGKTTLGRAILQLIPATSGKILVNGNDITQLHAVALRKMRQNLQIVFQDPYGSLNPRITIGDAILEPLNVHDILDNKKARKEKAIELLEKVNLSADHFHRYPHQFSGGQRQRICIARALAMNPSFLIFDESVSALDVSVQAQVLNLLNDLKKEFGFTAIFISHDLSVVRYISDRIAVMHKGKIIEMDTAEKVYNTPAQEYTQQLLAAIPGRKQLNLHNGWS